MLAIFFSRPFTMPSLMVSYGSSSGSLTVCVCERERVRESEAGGERASGGVHAREGEETREPSLCALVERGRFGLAVALVSTPPLDDTSQGGHHLHRTVSDTNSNW